MAVTCGIRQGCPLAPLLYIVTLNALYRAVDTDVCTAGIRFDTEAGPIDMKISRYAEDTALYLCSRTIIPRTLEQLRMFGAVFGLEVNVAKSVVLPLGQNAVSRPHECAGTKVISDGETCRYLSIQVGPTKTGDANWDPCELALRTRLRLAFAKTHSVIQRADIARAIIVPKVAYIARHSWLTQATIQIVQEFVRSFVWSCTQKRRARAWTSKPSCQLKVADWDCQTWNRDARDGGSCSDTMGEQRNRYRPSSR